VSNAHLGPATKFFFLLEISFRKLPVCNFVAPSLTRGRVCTAVQLLLGLARAVTLGSKSRRIHDHILLFHLKLPNLEGQVLVFISPRNRVAQFYPRALGSLFVTSYGGGILDQPASTRVTVLDAVFGTTNC
jgi:hypothetical protein